VRGRDGVSSAVLYATAGQLDQLDAALWLRGELAEGARAAKELGTAANEAGIPWHVVYRAKAIAGAVGYRKGFGPGSRVFWRLEEHKSAAEENEASGLPEPKEPDFTIENENSGFSHGADRDTFSDPQSPAEMPTDLGSEGRNSGFKAADEADPLPPTAATRELRRSRAWPNPSGCPGASTRAPPLRICNTITLRRCCHSIENGSTMSCFGRSTAYSASSHEERRLNPCNGLYTARGRE